MPDQRKEQSQDTETTSETLSETELTTKQLRQELNKLLHVLNKQISRTAYMSAPQEYQVPALLKRLFKEQRKHTKKMLENMPESEQRLLLKELSLEEESTKPKLILPRGVAN